MAGNLMGRRVKFAYTSDNGEVYRITTDEDLVFGEAGTEGTNLAGTSTAPKGFTPRGVHVQAFIPGEQGTGASADTPGRVARKFIVCNPGSELYASDSPQTLTIDGVLFTTTGRKGETQRFI